MLYETQCRLIEQALDAALAQLDEDDRGAWELGNELRAALMALDSLERAIVRGIMSGEIA